jgi:hypothetical protein
VKQSMQIRNATLALVLMFGGVCRAQYETPHEYGPQETRYISAGAMMRDFAPRSGYTGGDSAAIGYNAWMPMLGYHQGPVDMQFGYMRYTLRGVTCSAVYAGVTASNDFPLLRGTPSSLVLPLILSVDYTKSESAGAGRKHFLVGSLGLGTGLKGRLVSPGMEFTANITVAYHYSFEAFDTGSGSSLATAGEAALLLRTIRIVDGIVVGYRFRHQLWTLGDGRLNYRVNTHGPFIGVLL